MHIEVAQNTAEQSKIKNKTTYSLFFLTYLASTSTRHPSTGDKSKTVSVSIFSVFMILNYCIHDL